MSTTFVVGYDGSGVGKRALHFALERAEATGAKLIVAHVMEWSPYSFLTPDELAERHKRREAEMQRAEEAVIGPVKAELEKSPVEVETEIRYGNVADTLIKIARDTGANQIFVGREGQSSLSARFFGSVAASLAQAAPVPCTIVP